MPNERLRLLRQLIAQRIVVIDGATGTSIQDMGLSADDFGGPKLEGCNENLVRTRPDKIRELHRGFLAVGADIIETNSFGSTSIALAHYGLEDQVREINRIAAQLARAEADAAGTAARPRFVAGSMGPTTASISVTGRADFDQVPPPYEDQPTGTICGGAVLV